MSLVNDLHFSPDLLISIIIRKKVDAMNADVNGFRLGSRVLIDFCFNLMEPKV